MGSTSKSTRSGARSHRCEYCQKEFVRKSNLTAHRKIHLFKKDFKCSFCQYVTNFKPHLYRHILRHTKERPYKCGWPNCNAAFSGLSDRNQHVNSVHKKDDESLKKFKCPKCPYKTGRKGSLKAHLKPHSEVKEFSCDLCPFRTNTKRNIKRHHDNVHLLIKPFTCQHPNCNSAFNRKDRLKQHQLVHNRNNTRLFKFKCSQCDYMTSFQDHLNRHLVVHSEVKPFSCDLCPFRSKHMNSMKRHHNIVHSTLESFKCPESNCSYSAKTKSNLTGHIKVHLDFKEFACSFPLCTYRAKRKSAMKTHEMTHRNEKPFKCTLCSFKCNHKSGLCIHIRGHTGETPYPCPSCPFRGKSLGNLRIHKRKHHFENTLSP